MPWLNCIVLVSGEYCLVVSSRYQCLGVVLICNMNNPMRERLLIVKIVVAPIVPLTHEVERDRLVARQRVCVTVRPR